MTALTGDGFDVVFEASGVVLALRQAIEMLRRGGQLVQIGVFSAEEISLPVNQFLIGEFQFLDRSATDPFSTKRSAWWRATV